MKLMNNVKASQRIAELEIALAHSHQEYMESLNVRDNLEDMVKDLRAACDQKQEIINADTHIRKDDTARIAELEAEECSSAMRRTQSW